MRKRLIEALATKFVGVDAKILGRIADDIIASGKTIESEEDLNSAVEEVDFARVLKSYGDSRATEASRTAVSNYEKKHGLKDGKPLEDDDDDDDSNDDEPSKDDEGKKKVLKGKKPTDEEGGNEQMNAVLKSLTALATKFDRVSEELTALKQGKVVESRKARLNDITKELKASQKKAYDRLNLEGYSDEEFNDFIDEVTNEVAEIVKDNNASGGTFGTPIGGNHEPSGNKATDAELAEVIDSISI